MWMLIFVASIFGGGNFHRIERLHWNGDAPTVPVIHFDGM